jgi:hypothetical protein
VIVNRRDRNTGGRAVTTPCPHDMPYLTPDLGRTAYEAWTGNHPRCPAWTHLTEVERSRWREAALASAATASRPRLPSDRSAFGETLREELEVVWRHVQVSSHAGGPDSDNHVWRMYSFLTQALAALESLGPRLMRDDVLADATRAVLDTVFDVGERERRRRFEEQDDQIDIDWDVPPPVARPTARAAGPASWPYRR